MSAKPIELLDVRTRVLWRKWLKKHNDSKSEMWLVFHKRHTGIASISYDDAVEEALCFGWIDSIIRRLDADRYVRKFTPRRTSSVWSEKNKARIEKLIAEGRMTDVGLALVRGAKSSGDWDRGYEPTSVPADHLPEELRTAFERHPDAAKTFHALAPSYRKQYVMWIATAKRLETRQRRTQEAIEKLKRGERLGLK